MSKLSGIVSIRDNRLMGALHHTNINSAVIDGTQTIIFTEAFHLPDAVGRTDQGDARRRAQH